MSLSIHNLHKSFGQTPVLNGIEIDATQGEFLVLLGASGCGKSTLLHCIAGLEPITSGEIFIKEKAVQDLLPADRNVAMVFQNYALYPTMTVARNITFGLECSGASKSEQRDALQQISSLLKIQDLLERKPRQLSGGQRQRVAIGRSLVRNPDLFLMDEPMSNLDARLRLEMRSELRSLHATLGATMVFVTHDQTEAMSLATRVAVMDQGRIRQIGTPYDLYHAPNSLFVAEFIGTPGINLVPGTLHRQDDSVVFQKNDLHLNLESYQFTSSPEEGTATLLGIRPESLVPASLQPASNSSNSLEMTVTDVEMTGGDLHVRLKNNGIDLTTRMASSKRIRPGDKIKIFINLDAISLFDPTQETRL